MKAKTILLARVILAALALFVSAPAQAAPAWPRVALDAHVSAEFPALPKLTSDHGDAGLQAVSPDGRAVYVVSAFPSGLAANAPASARAAFYQGPLGKVPFGGRLVTQRLVEVAGVPALEFVYTSTTGLGEVINTNRLVALGSTAYFFMTGSLTATQAELAADRARFFGSIRTGAGSAKGVSPALTMAPREPTAEARALFSPSSIVAGSLGGLGALWLMWRRARAKKPGGDADTDA